MSRISREQAEQNSRPKRIPLNEANRDKLVVPGLDNENYMYRWVNDVEGRLAAFLAAWWEFVDQTGAPVGDGGVEQSEGVSSKYVKGVGHATTAHLMRIPKEFWLEDQESKERNLKEQEAEIKRNIRSIGDYGKVDISIKT